MPDSINAFVAMLLAFLPDLLAAILVLVVGWLIAFLVSKLVENLLRRTTLDDRIAGALQGGTPERLPVERWIALAVFWLIMLFVLLIFFQTLNLDVVAGPVDNVLAQVLAFLPRLLAAAALTVLAWIIASVLRLVITRVANASVFTRRVTETANVDTRNRVSIGQTMGTVVYWLVFLLFLPAILGALNLTGILAPVSSMVNSILGALPNILGAIVVLAIGYLVARIIRQIVSNLLDGIGINRLGDRTGVNTALREKRLSDVVATIVFVLIMIPVAIAALNVLDIPAVSQPAANMLNQVLNAIPAIFGAFLLLAIAYFVARLVGTLVSSILAGIGFNRLFSPGGAIPVAGLGAAATFPTEGSPSVTTARTTDPGEAQVGRTTPSEIVGYIVTVAVILFAATEAANMLGFEALGTLLNGFIVAAVNIIFGLVIFGLGLFLANQVYRLVNNTGTGTARVLAQAARVAIIVFAAALALRQMGIAESIVNLAFGLLLGAVAVAAAIAFGFGGRDLAAQLLERFRNQVRAESARPTPPTPPVPPTTPSIPRTGMPQDRGSDFTPTGSSSDTGFGTNPTDFPPLNTDEDPDQIR